MAKSKYFRYALPHEIPVLESLGWQIVFIDRKNPSGALYHMGLTPVLMEYVLDGDPDV